MKLQSRRDLLTRTLEFASMVPLLGLIAENFRNRTSYYEIETKAAEITTKLPQTTLEHITQLTSSMKSSVDNLADNYREAYHKSHTRLVPYTHKVGKSTVTSLRTETYYRWEEPSNVPDHSIIENWQSFQANFSAKVNNLSSGATIDLAKLRELAVKKQQTGVGSEGLVSLGLYAPQIAALLFYEEAIATMRHGYEKHDSAEELVDRHDTQPQITRRSFLKMGAALAGALVAFPIVSANQQRREEGRNKLEGEIRDMKFLREISAEKAFSRYFGSDAKGIIQTYTNQLELAKRTLQANVEEEVVRDSFNQFVKVGEPAITSLNQIIGRKIPEEIEDLTKSTLIADNLRDKSQSEHRAVYTSLGLTSLAVAGTMAAVLLPSELTNEYVANRFEKKS